MNNVNVSLLAGVGRGGLIGCEGHLPKFENIEMAKSFQAMMNRTLEGGIAIMGGRTYRRSVEVGFDKRACKFETIVWDRGAQEFFRDPMDLLTNLAVDNKPIFIVGGEYTFRTFLPFVDHIILSRVPLILDGNPIYMPDMFATVQ